MRAGLARSQARATRADRLLAMAFVAGLAWAPFWLGGAWRLPWGVNALLFPGLALSYEISRLASRRELPVPTREIGAPAALFLIAVLWIVAQMAPFAHVPAIAPLGENTPATISVNPGATAITLTRLLTDAAAFWLAAQLGRERELSLRLLQAVAAIAALYSVYGLFLAVNYDNAIPGFAPADGGGEVRSTFINRNSFAAYAGLGLVTSLALVARDRRSASRAPRLALWLEAAGARGGVIAAGLVAFVALVGTASRGGMASAAVGIFVFFGLVAARRRRRGESYAGLLVGLAALLAAFALFGGRIVARLADAGLADAGRLPVYRIVARAALERPLTGFGYGAFADTFPLVRDATLSPIGVWEMAHNSYLELALGLGLVFGAALPIALGLIAARCVVGALVRNRDAEAPLAAASAAALIAVNGLVDYSVQIEAVTLTFMTLLGLGVAQSRNSQPTC